MTEAEIQHISEDIEIMKKDIAIIKNILIDEEGELTEEAKKRLAEARATPNSEYVELWL